MIVNGFIVPTLKKYLDGIEVDYIDEIKELMSFIEDKQNLSSIALAKFQKKSIWEIKKWCSNNWYSF